MATPAGKPLIELAAEGKVLQFLGYSEKIEDPILAPGDFVIVRAAVTEAGSMTVERLGPGGKPMGLSDSLFPEEAFEPDDEALSAFMRGEIVPFIIDVTAEEVSEPAADTAEAPATADPVGLVEGAVEADQSDEITAIVDAAPAPKAEKAKASKGKGKGKAAEPVEAITDSDFSVFDDLEVEAPETLRPVGVKSETIAAIRANAVVEQSRGRSYTSDEKLGHLETAKSLVDQVEQKYFTLGGVLSDIYDQEMHKLVEGCDGKRGFAIYTKRELGVEYRKAMYLINIYKRLSGLGKSDADLAAIGWSKAKEILKVSENDEILEDRFDELAEYARTHSRDDLVKYISSQTVDAGEPVKVKLAVFNFKVHQDSAATIKAAIEEATKKLDGPNPSPSQALEFIVSEWRIQNSGIEVPLDEQLRLIEQRYGVTLQVTTGAASVSA